MIVEANVGDEVEVTTNELSDVRHLNGCVGRIVTKVNAMWCVEMFNGDIVHFHGSELKKYVRKGVKQ